MLKERPRVESKPLATPKVIIHKREMHDSYAVAITNGSDDYLDAVLMASMEFDCKCDAFETWSRTGYYMARRILELEAKLAALNPA